MLTKKFSEQQELQIISEEQYRDLLNNIDFSNRIVDDDLSYELKNFVLLTLKNFFLPEERILLVYSVIRVLNTFQSNNQNIMTWLDDHIKHFLSQVNNNEKQIFLVAASRFLLLKLYFSYSFVHKTKKIYGDMKQHIINNIKTGYYDASLINFMEYLPEICLSRDLLFDYSALRYFASAYILTGAQYAIQELPQHVFSLMSLVLASKYDIPQQQKIKTYEFYDVLSNKYLSLSTPFLSNLRTKRYQNLSSCFILQVDDSIESMFYNNFSVGCISKHGGGVGINVSRIRSEGSRVGYRENSSCGPMLYTKIINDTGLSVNQSGKRVAAVTVALDIWHKDIFGFLDLQTEHGDLRKKAYDIYPQIVIHDLFMEFYKKNKDWMLIDPYDVRNEFKIDLVQLHNNDFRKQYLKLYNLLKNSKNFIHVRRKFVSSRKLLSEILKLQIETGLPYIFFKDTVNYYNSHKDDGVILSGNLCQESFTNFNYADVSVIDGDIKAKNGLAHTCNLASINLSRIFDDKTLEYVVKIAVHILDNSIDITKEPIKESTNHNTRYRSIGIGALGLHDHLAWLRKYYVNSVEYVDKLFEKILFFALSESNHIAKVKGTYQAFKTSEWYKGNILNIKKSDLKNSDLDWKTLKQNIKQHGLRNGYLLAIAPNTSTSIVNSCSASVLPVYDNFFTDSNSRIDIPIVSRYLNSREEFYTQTYSKMLLKQVVNVISSIQKWIDQGISFELLYDLNNNINATYIRNMVFYIHEKKCKTIYYVRSLQKDVTNIGNKNNNDGVGCDSCSM